MAVSKTEILNKDLTLLGANPVVSISDDSQNARILSRVYDTALRSILSETQWTFATRRKSLNQVDVTLDWYDTGEVYVYNRPNLCVRIFGVNSPTATWREEGEYVISDSSDLGVRYVYFLEQPSKYSASFIDAFADKLASEIAYMVLNSQTSAQSFLEKYNKVSLPKAMAENAQIGTPVYQSDDAWLNAKDGNLADV